MLNRQKGDDMMVQCKITGRWYDPVIEFNKLLQDPKIVAIMQRLKER